MRLFLHKHASKAAGHLPQLAKGARRAWLVVLQRREELRSSRTAETVVAEGQGVAWAGVDLRDELAQVLHVVVANLGSALHDHGGENDGIHLAIWDPESVLLATELLEELITESSIQLVAEGCGLKLFVRVIFVVTIVGETHGRFGFAADVEVLVALEKACDAMISFSLLWTPDLGNVELQVRRWEGSVGRRKDSHIPQRPMVR